ncbi:MAG: hypothetical protein SFW09_02680 [Hyphomicrobiaceae bacterium]|nr:hypothetical protein [Hyphomicrobiaceae bacterium]
MSDGGRLVGGPASEQDDGKLRKRAMGAFRIGRYLHKLWSFLGTNAGAATTTAAGTAALAGVVAVTTPDVLGLKPREATSVIRHQVGLVETRRLDQTSLVFPLEGRDADGRRVLFDLVVLSRDLAWARASDREITLAGKTVAEADISRIVFGRELTAALAASQEVIVAGVASVEGAEATEAERAGRRAETAAGWAERVVPARTPITALNLGQFRSECSNRVTGDTAWQRPLMVIAVRERQRQADVKEALANALSDKTNVPSPACYTKFEMRGIR